MLTKTGLKQIKGIVQVETTKTIKGELKPIKNDISKIRKDIDVIISLFDKEYINLRERV